MGTAEFAVPALEAVREHVVLVVSQPDRPTGRGLSLRPSPVKEAAIRHGLQVETPEKARDLAFVRRITSLDADCLLVAAYGQILSQDMLDSTKRGGINLHGSILPKYRGAAPIQRSILDDETETGVTLMQMDKGMDTGDIIEARRVQIEPDETAGDLTPRLAALAAAMASEWMPPVCSGDYPRAPQDHSHATLAPKVEKAEARLRFEAMAKDEYNRFRAFTPAPGAFIETNLGTVKITQARLEVADATPGVVLRTRPELVLGFNGGAIVLREVQPPGKARMSGADWANGARITAGDCLSA